MKTIELAIPETKERRTLKESLREAGFFGLRVSKNFLSNIVGSYLGTQTGEFVKEGIDEFMKKILPHLKNIEEFEKNTIYFQGQGKIEKEMEKARAADSNLKIVVFIDDLDRCSPEKVIEVFESIKIFLGMDGFVYVLGLSHDKILQLIKKRYSFDNDREAELYIKKIIQIPIMIPEWTVSEPGKLIEEVLSSKLDSRYSSLIVNNKDLLSKAVELSPREIKRLINTFIITNEIFSINQGAEPKELLIVLTLRLRWNAFYKYFS